MLSLVPMTRELRSSGFQLLSVPGVKTHAGTGALSVAVPMFWNSLSEHVKSSNSIVSSACEYLKVASTLTSGGRSAHLAYHVHKVTVKHT